MSKTTARILLALIVYSFLGWLMPLFRPTDLPYLQAVLATHVAIGLLAMAAALFVVCLYLSFIAFPQDPNDPL